MPDWPFNNNKITQFPDHRNSKNNRVSEGSFTGSGGGDGGGGDIKDLIRRIEKLEGQTDKIFENTNKIQRDLAVIDTKLDDKPNTPDIWKISFTVFATITLIAFALTGVILRITAS